jgi:hypothetical protein
VKSVVKEVKSNNVHALFVRIPEGKTNSKNRGLTLIEELVGEFFNMIPYIYSPYIDDLRGIVQFDFDLNDDSSHTDLVVSIYIVGKLPSDITIWTKHICETLSNSRINYDFIELGAYCDEHDLAAMVFPMFPSKDTLKVIFKDQGGMVGSNIEDQVLLLHNCLPIDLASLIGVEPSITHFNDIKNEVLKPLVMDTYEYKMGIRDVPKCALFSGEWRDLVNEMSTWDEIGVKRG